MMMAFDIKISDDVAKLTLSGDIDLQISGDIKAEIERLGGVEHLEIDASAVSYIDSSGVAVLIFARQYCAQNNMALALPSVSAAVHRVLQIAKLDAMLPIGQIVSAPEPEEFGFGAGNNAFDAGDAGAQGNSAFESDDDLVNSLLSDNEMADGTTGTAAVVENGDLAGVDLVGADHSDDNLGGDFDGLDVNAVDFSEPATTTTPAEATDEEPDPLPDGDALKPGTFS
jgi:anti-sigma B factor antagonist